MQFETLRACLRLGFVGVVGLAGCAGNGDGLDQNGRPTTGGADAPLTADLKSIQDHVFTPICTQCHIGAAAPLGFRLDEASAYAMLVNAPSAEVSSLHRVTPGDPDSSYLIQKLEGHAAVGGQMPLGQPPLPAATIAIIRQWITNGALATAAAVDVMPMQIHAITPAAGESLAPAGSEILLQAAGELNAATVNDSSVLLIRSGGDGSFSEGNEVRVQPIHIEVRSLDPTVLAISLDGGAWISDSYRFSISGQGDARVMDHDGLPAGNFTLQFSVGGTP